MKGKKYWDVMGLVFIPSDRGLEPNLVTKVTVTLEVNGREQSVSIEADDFVTQCLSLRASALEMTLKQLAELTFKLNSLCGLPVEGITRIVFAKHPIVGATRVGRIDGTFSRSSLHSWQR
ncbi:MAG: hypothetical protein ACREXR_18265 [Gammaproteobacteria bacterium]